jgi:hypothetical protein
MLWVKLVDAAMEGGFRTRLGLSFDLSTVVPWRRVMRDPRDRAVLVVCVLRMGIKEEALGWLS